MSEEHTITGLEDGPPPKCRDCERVRPLVARGLCGTCYKRAQKDGRLDEFPKKFPAERDKRSRLPSRKTEEPDIDEALEPAPFLALDETIEDEARAIEYVYAGLRPLEQDARDRVLEYVTKRLEAMAT